jgi:hypothetical protein
MRIAGISVRGDVSPNSGFFLLHIAVCCARTLTGVFKTGVRRTWNLRSSMARKVCPNLIRKGNTS